MPHNSVPNTVKPRFAEIIGLVEEVCRAHLTEEYAAVTRELAAALARKRPSPLLRGHSRTWACRITYTVGVNFLFDPAQQPHVRGVDLCAFFGVSPSAGSAKVASDHAALRHRSAGSALDGSNPLVENPLVWMISVNGVIVDMRMMPRELQERAYELGLIPFVPAAGRRWRELMPRPAVHSWVAGELPRWSCGPPRSSMCSVRRDSRLIVTARAR